ncbi:MAG: hypothetical protein J3K34DRAFT_458441 [Monoraphidium minutum]|nr:MAG: hypothetical protein J3K34DRAFT_458441 [Monoraphidium minutum]
MDAGDVETLYPSERLALARMAAAAQQQQQQRQQQQRQQQQQAQAQAQQKQAAMLMHSGPAALAAAAANGDDVFALGGFAMDQRPCGGLLSPAGLLGKRGGGGSGAALAAAGGGGSGQQLIPKSSSLYVKNLPLDADKCFLYERFAPYGAIMSVKVLCDSDTKVCRGVGFVNFAQHDDAARAMQALHGTKIGDRLLHVSLQTPRIRAVV